MPKAFDWVFLLLFFLSFPLTVFAQEAYLIHGQGMDKESAIAAGVRKVLKGLIWEKYPPDTQCNGKSLLETAYNARKSLLSYNIDKERGNNGSYLVRMNVYLDETKTMRLIEDCLASTKGNEPEQFFAVLSIVGLEKEKNKRQITRLVDESEAGILISSELLDGLISRKIKAQVHSIGPGDLEDYFDEEISKNKSKLADLYLSGKLVDGDGFRSDSQKLAQNVITVFFRINTPRPRGDGLYFQSATIDVTAFDRLSTIISQKAFDISILSSSSEDFTSLTKKAAEQAATYIAGQIRSWKSGTSGLELVIRNISYNELGRIVRALKGQGYKLAGSSVPYEKSKREARLQVKTDEYDQFVFTDIIFGALKRETENITVRRNNIVVQF